MSSSRLFALCLGLFAANAAAQSTTDYDDDNDNLIDIRTLAQLNAIRYDLDGNGTVSSSDAANYTAAFTNRATGMGCAATCTGYELRQNLNFDTDGDEDVDSSDTGSYPNWSPIGGTYSATFEGNGFTISHLTIVNAPGSAGLFNEVSGTVRNLGVADANVSGVGGSLTQIGALAGEIAGGTVIASWASGQVRVGPGSTSRPRVGGLVGRVSGAGRLAACYSTVNVTGAGKASTYTGGLVGSVFNGPKIVACYATGVISGGGGNAYVGGLIGTNIGPSEVRASYFAGTVTGGSVLNGVTAENDGSGENYYNVYFDTDTTDLTGDEGQSTANLQRPTDASGIYANWDDLDVNGNGTADEDPWNFGTVNQYPVLNYGSHSTATQFTKQAPSYTGITVSNKDYRWGETITSFEIPPPTGGNGAYGYTVTGLPAGLVFDEDGTGDCMAARTVCGTPSVWGMATVTVIVADADGNTMNSDRASLTFTVTVAAPPLGVRVSPPRLSLAEGGSGAYTVVLSHAPTGPVTVGVSSDNPAVTVATSSLTFTTQNWNTARSVTVTGAGDADAVDEAATITNAASGGGYNGVSGFVRVGVADDEPSAGTDYDADNDGLIDVDSLAQLNAMRWDLDGDGAPSSGNAANYAAAFTSAAAGMGCPDGPDANQLADACGGYALTADLDFDTSGDGKVDADDEFASWTPIVGWDTMLDGRGHAISNLTVTGAGNDRGLFATATTNATVRALGLADVSVTGTGVRLGALAGVFNGRVAAVYATGVVRGAGGVAGLVAETQSTSARIVASYSLVAVECTSSQNWARAGGLAARNDGTITTSYAAGAITGDCPATVKGGLASVNNGTVTASYWDADQTGIADDTDNPPQSPEGLSSSAMWTPTAYGASASDVYNVWDEQDLDGDGAVDEDPWHFGGALNHPVLKWGGLDPADQRTNYDADGDRLIDIATLGQLNAVRWDLDGDGAPSSGNESSYWGTGAFFNGVFNPSGVGFCPTTTDDADDNDCLGYELVGDLDFDTDGDGSTWTAPGGTVTGDTGDAYDNAGAGWMSIGSTAANAAANYAATFDGNGHVIRNLFINRSTWLYQGLFAGTTANANITSLGLPNVRIQAAQNLTGGLVGVNRGRIAAVWTSGTVRAGSAPGGLVGSTVTATARVVASYSTAAVECTSSASSAVAGGLVGYHDGGSIAASYSTGTVTGACPAGNKGVFALVAGGTVAASYWDTTQTGVADDTENPPQPPEGRTTAALQAPTDYDAVVGGEALYADWDDQDVDGDGATGDDDDADPWDFGLSNQHPILKYGGLAAAPQLDAQPDRAPTFGTSTVANMRFQRGRAIQSFQVPAASAGNGVLTYVDSGLPAGLEFDADGSGSCPGNAPRMVCGTPTATTTAPVTVTITVRDADSNMDSTDEGALTFTVEVVEPSAAISSPAALAEATLNNATVTVALTNAVFESGVTASSFTLNATLSGLRIASLATVTAGDASATLTLGYSSGNFDRVGTLSVTVADSAHTLAGALTTPTVNILPTPSVSVNPTSLSLTEGGSGGTYSVVLGGQPLGNVTVEATSGDAAVSIDSDATPQTRTLAFTPMTWNTAQTVTATPADDDDAEDESVAISHGVSPNYGATAASVSVTVEDDETKGIVIDADPSTATMVDAGPLALTEGAASSTPYTVKLASQPTGTVTVTVTSADATVATADTDPATGMQNTLSFTTTTWDTAQTVRLTPADDTDPNNEEVDIRHEANGGGYNGVSAILQATVADNDVGVLVDTDPNLPGDQTTPLALREGGTRTYLVRLSTLPVGGVVTVTATSSNAAITATPGSLSFNAGNWQTAQTVTVRAEQDDDAVGEWTDIANEANGGQYSGETTTVRATATDDEMSGADYDADDDNLIEIDSLAKLYAVRWDLNGDGDVDSSANEANYRSAFAGSIMAEDMGCPDGPDVDDEGECAGYELTADLDFDTDADGDVDADDPNSYASWIPIGKLPGDSNTDVRSYTTTFQGNGHTISNVRVNRPGDYYVGFFSRVGSGGRVTGLGLVNPDIYGNGDVHIGALAAINQGTIGACYVLGGRVRSAGPGSTDNMGGFVGHNDTGTIVNSYVSGTHLHAESAGTNAFMAGFVSDNDNGTIRASYAVATHSGPSGARRFHGVVSRSQQTVTDTYWDSSVSSRLGNLYQVSYDGSQSTTNLQGQLGYSGIYANWNNHDVDGDGAIDDVWDFGTANNYPALKYGEFDPALQRTDYDADADGLIDITTLGQLNAVRWDLDGNGAPSTGNEASFHAAGAFLNPRFQPGGAGLCPTTEDDADDNDCRGYELLNDLDFDTNGSGATWTAPGGTVTGDTGDAYNNAGAGWMSIGSTAANTAANYAATFDGNGHVIDNLFINRGTWQYQGLFAGTTANANITSLGLPNIRIQAAQNLTGGLVGVHRGRIAAVWSSGTVRAGSAPGGLVGGTTTANARVIASYSAAAVECTSSASSAVAGGLVGYHDGGLIAASYSTGRVTGACPAGSKGALALVGNGTVAASYWDTTLSQIADDTENPPQPPEGRTTAVLQAPTSYDTVVGDPGEAIYAAWDDQDVDGDGISGEAEDDDPWDFGRANQHPILKYRGLAPRQQLDAQPDTAPDFSGTVANMTLPGAVAVEFQVPAATGGDGAYRYEARGLPAGLSFGLPDCATERTVCGTPTAAYTGFVAITVNDGDSNMAANDRDTLTFLVTVPAASASIASTTPSALVETNLNGATLKVELSGTVFVGGVSPSSFQLATTPTIAGLSIASAVRDSPTQATLTLRFDDTNFDTQATLLVRVLAAAHRFGGDQETGTVAVAPVRGMMLSATTLALAEDPGTSNANVGTYTAVLTGQPTGTVTVTVASADPAAVTVDTAAATGLQSTLSFTPTNWDTAQTVTLTAVQDVDSNSEETAIDHAAQGGGYDGATARLVATVADDDVGVIVDTEPNTSGDQTTPLALNEGQIATYRVRLSTLPAGGNVTVAVSSDNPAIDVAPGTSGGTFGSAASLTFTATDWATAQTVRVLAEQDADAVGERGTIANNPDGAQYGSTAAINIAATAQDDEMDGADYDADDDNLIEIDSLAKLNAVRWDLDGDGDVDSSANEASYRSAFAGSIMAEDMGCLDGPDVDDEGDCAGYELATDLDFDTDDDGDVDADDPNSHANWAPIGGTYSATFDGNNHVISNLTIVDAAGNAALFDGVSGTVRSLGLADADVSGVGGSTTEVAPLVAELSGKVIASWASGRARAGATGNPRVAGLVGRMSGSSALLSASYSTARVAGASSSGSFTGGLVGSVNIGPKIVACYATGAVSGGGFAGGLIADNTGPTTVAASYFAGSVAGGATTAGVTAQNDGSNETYNNVYFDAGTTGLDSGTGRQTTSDLQTPTSATGTLYAAWDDLDVDGDGDADEDPWDFGTAHNHPALNYGGLDPADQRNDYDADDDGLIDITTLQQLNALRWDVDGDGAPAPGATSTAAYFSATSSFFNARFNAAGTGLACPTTPDDADDNDCAGYELLNDLDFDTDGDGDVDANDPNSYANWTPVPGWAATLDGGGHVIKNLTVSGAGDDRGLFATGTTAATVRSLGLVDVSVTTPNVRAGALAGVYNGRIAAVYATGSVTGAGGVGGLVGQVESSSARIVASYAAVDVECTFNANWAHNGGLTARNDGVISASYATGKITGNCPATHKGGLVSNSPGTEPASYWDTDLTTIGDDTDSPPQPPEGKTSAVLQAPTGYDTIVGDPGAAIYAAWDEQDVDGDGETGDGDDADPWDFGRSNQHPILKYAGLAAGPQLDAQPDTAPVFATSTPLAAMTLPGNVAVEFQLPTVTAGNGAYVYTPTGLPAGLSLGLPNCATARTLCGTPTAATSTTVTVTVDDSDSNEGPGDRDAVTFMITVPAASARIADTTPTALMEANLDGATLRVVLSGTVFNASISPSSFQLATAPTIAGLSIASAIRVSDTEARLRLRFDRTDFTARSTLLVRVLAAAHRFGGDQETGTVAVAPSGGVMLSATELTLQEAPGSTNANVGTYTVVLTGQPPGTATVTPASSNPDVTLSGPLTFAATTWNTPQTVTVTAGEDDDAVDDAAFITHAVQGIPGVASGPLVRVRVNDDDSQGLTLDAATLTGSGVTEGMAATYTAVLDSEPTGPVTVAIASSEGTVTVDADFGAAGAQSTLLFHAMNWNMAQTVTVRAVEDDDGEGGSVTLTHDASGADYGELADAEVSFTVTDDDAKGATLSATALNVQENGTAEYTLVLDTKPVGGPVSVAVASTTGTVATARPSTLTFTAQNWDAPQTVTVAGVDDTDTADESETISHTPTGGGYDGVAVSDVTATAVDDDVAGLKVSPVNLAVAEGATATYSVRLNVAPTATTTVTVGGATAKVTADADPNAPGDQTTLTFDAANWNAARTVRVTSVADADGADEVVDLTHAVTGAGDYASVSAARRPGVTVRVEDAQTAGVVAEPDSLEIDEGGTATYQLRLSAPPASGTTTVTVAAAGAAGLRVATSSPTFAATTSLLFDAASWNAAQTVTVLAVADHDRLTDAEGVLTHAAANYGAVMAGPDVRVAVRNATVDHDPDADGLIDIDSLAKLNAVRWDLDGDGTPAPTATSSYAAAFPNPRGGAACPSAVSGVTCRGYELTADLDFDTDGDGSTWTETGGVVSGDEGDDYYNGGLGWAPIGNLSSPPSSYFNATFRGNGHLVRNLFIDQSGASGSNTYVGFFGLVHSGGRIESLGLVDGHVRVAGTGGLLAGWSHGEVAGCYSTGSVVATPVPNLFGHNRTVGGLIGAIGSSYGSHGSVTTSYSTARATTAIAAGGLIGEVSNPGSAAIVDSYATGPVSHDGGVGDPRLGGLVGRVVGGNTAATTASYYDRDATGQTSSARGVGQSTADLQRPTGYDGIYATWNIDLDGDYAPDDPWDFGTSGQYPSLKWGGFDPARQFAAAAAGAGPGSRRAAGAGRPSARSPGGPGRCVPGRRRGAGHRPGRGVPGSGGRAADLRGVQFRSGRGLGFGGGRRAAHRGLVGRGGRSDGHGHRFGGLERLPELHRPGGGCDFLRGRRLGPRRGDHPPGAGRQPPGAPGPVGGLRADRRRRSGQRGGRLGSRRRERRDGSLPGRGDSGRTRNRDRRRRPGGAAAGVLRGGTDGAGGGRRLRPGAEDDGQGDHRGGSLRSGRAAAGRPARSAGLRGGGRSVAAAGSESGGPGGFGPAPGGFSGAVRAAGSGSVEQPSVGLAERRAGRPAAADFAASRRQSPGSAAGRGAGGASAAAGAGSVGQPSGGTAGRGVPGAFRAAAPGSFRQPSVGAGRGALRRPFGSALAASERQPSAGSSGRPVRGRLGS